MKKRKRSKLKLNRETLRNLDPDKLSQVAGAGQCTSDRCSNNCTGENCTGGGSECVCPLTDHGETDQGCGFPTVVGCTLCCTCAPTCLGC